MRLYERRLTMFPPSRPNTPIQDYIPQTRPIEWEQMIIGEYIANGWERQESEDGNLIFSTTNSHGRTWKNCYNRTTKQLAYSRIYQKCQRNWLNEHWGD